MAAGLIEGDALVVGAGVAGCVAAGQLVAAGVGNVGIVDGGEVRDSDVGPGLLHYPTDVGSSKAESAAKKLALLNPAVLVEPYPAWAEEANVAALTVGRGVVLDCTGDRDAALLINDACVRQGVALVHASRERLDGDVLTVVPGDGACRRCAASVVSAETPDADDESAEFAALGSILGSVQALEAIKLLTGTGETLVNRLLHIDGAEMTFEAVPVRHRDDCEVCGEAAVASVKDGS